MATAQCISIISQAGKRIHLLFFGAHGAPTSEISCRFWGQDKTAFENERHARDGAVCNGGRTMESSPDQKPRLRDQAPEPRLIAASSGWVASNLVEETLG